MTVIAVFTAMGKRNPIHVLTLLLVTLASYVSAEHYYIVPNDYTIARVRTTELGLAEFASNSSYTLTKTISPLVSFQGNTY